MTNTRNGLLASFVFAACSPTPTPATVAPEPILANEAAPATAPRLRMMRVAHASVLIDFGGITVLTDPWFSEKAGYHPGEPLGVSIDNLPRLTAVVASHAHYDHFDIETFARYPHKDVPFYVGPDMVESARDAGFAHVRELTPGERATSGGLTVTAGPGAHGVPLVTYLLEAKGFSVYFAADTLLTPEVRSFAERHAPVDLVLPAVNGLSVLGEQVVMNPEEAAELSALARARIAVPTHYAFRGSWFTETFILRHDGTPERFVSAVAAQSAGTRPYVLSPGQWLSMARQ